MRATIIAGNSAKPETKMKPKPSTMFSAPWSIGPDPRSDNSGNNTAPTTIIPAARQAARKAKKMTNRRPISAMSSSDHRIPGTSVSPSSCPASCRASTSCFVTIVFEVVDGRDKPGHDDLVRGIYSIRHRHGAQRLAFARRQFFGLRLQLPAGGEDVAAARRAHRRGIAGVEDVLGEFLDLVPVRTFVGRARPGIERNEVDLRRNPLEQLHQQLRVIQRIIDAL